MGPVQGPTAEKAIPLRVRSLMIVIAAGLFTAGCAAVALPFRVTADVVRVVPLVGEAIAVPFDAAGNLIDN